VEGERAMRIHAASVTVTLGTLLMLAAPASAQQRPMVTEDPEPIGAGRVLLEGGIEAARSQKYPASGLEGKLFRIPLLGVSFGIGPTAELQLDMPLFDTLSITKRNRVAPLASLVTATGDSTHDVGDLVIGTKIRLVAEDVGHPAVAVRFATKLPNASNESGLGTDTTEFYGSMLLGKTVRSLRIVANGGFGILPDPVVGYRQNDVITYGLSLARALTDRSEIVGELNGRFSTRDKPFPGTESRGQAAIGGRFTTGSIRFDGKLFFGIQDLDSRIGFGAGFTYVFNAFQAP
jgi:hypothetical protein